jgi:FMN reductase
MMTETGFTSVGAAQADKLRIVGIGGTTRPGSASECATRMLLARLESFGADVTLIGGAQLAALPLYDPTAEAGNATALIEAIASAPGVVIVSPGYHGSVSGMIKNALDYLEELRTAPAPYLSGRPVGCVSTAHGWQATVSTMNALRSIVHALRGWPTPYGAVINSAVSRPGPDGIFDDPGTVASLNLVADQVLEFCHRWAD